jgi:hypothetical protein
MLDLFPSPQFFGFLSTFNSSAVSEPFFVQLFRFSLEALLTFPAANQWFIFPTRDPIAFATLFQTLSIPAPSQSHFLWYQPAMFLHFTSFRWRRRMCSLSDQIVLWLGECTLQHADRHFNPTWAKELAELYMYLIPGLPA